MTESPAGAPPPFIEEAVEEARSFVRTAFGFVRHPMKFSRGWASGEIKAMNPIGFFGTALGLQLGAKAIVEHLRPPVSDPNLDQVHALTPTLFWLGDLLAQQLPLAGAILFALVVHQRLRRVSGQPFGASLGVVLFADGIEAILRGAIVFGTLRMSAVDAQSFGDGATSIFEAVLLVLALVGVHRLRRWTEAIVPLLLAGSAVVVATVICVSPLIVTLIQHPPTGMHGAKAAIKIGSAEIVVKNDSPDAGPEKNRPDASTP